jgi:hypothetical protein
MTCSTTPDPMRAYYEFVRRGRHRRRKNHIARSWSMKPRRHPDLKRPRGKRVILIVTLLAVTVALAIYLLLTMRPR